MSVLSSVTSERRTGIVATVGPASEEGKILDELLLAGVDVFRFSYGRDSLGDNRRRVTRLKEAELRTGRQINLMMDLPGRKNRIISKETKWVRTGDRLSLGYQAKSKRLLGSDIQILFPVAMKKVRPGDLIYFGDGEFSAHVLSQIDEEKILIEFDNPGELAQGRGVTVVGASYEPGCALTPRDKYFLRHHAMLGFHYIALSFVNSCEDVTQLKEYLKGITNRQVGVVAKIETRDGVLNLEDIITMSEGIMIGRGDLGLNIPFEQLPTVQKQIIKHAKHQGKPVIVATQMLESVSDRQIPLRAEISDIAMAVYQGASAIMLSGETRTGKRPVYAVQIADRVIRQVEQELKHDASTDLE